MKLKVGNRLLTARQDQNLSQDDMAKLLSMSQSKYSRIEKNESSVDLEDILKYSQTLDIPIQDFLPDTISIHNDNKDSQNGQGLILGNIYNYNYAENGKAIEDKDKEIGFLQEKITLLEDKIKTLEEMLSMYREAPNPEGE